MNKKLSLVMLLFIVIYSGHVTAKEISISSSMDSYDIKLQSIYITAAKALAEEARLSANAAAEANIDAAVDAGESRQSENTAYTAVTAAAQESAKYAAAAEKLVADAVMGMHELSDIEVSEGKYKKEVCLLTSSIYFRHTTYSEEKLRAKLAVAEVHKAPILEAVSRDPQKLYKQKKAANAAEKCLMTSKKAAAEASAVEHHDIIAAVAAYKDAAEYAAAAAEFLRVEITQAAVIAAEEAVQMADTKSTVSEQCCILM